MEVMTRKAALAAGLKRYFTGRPCPRGHLVGHRIYGGCIECARLDKIRWREANPERVKELKLAEQKRNRASANARNRKWLAANREQSNAASRDWALRHPEKVASRAALRRASKLRQTPVWADRDAIGILYRAAEMIRASGFDVHVDHVIPLQGEVVSGLHVHKNLQIIQAKANQSKSNRF